MKLLIKFPTRNRPNKFLKVLNTYVRNLDDKTTKIIVSCDLDDDTMTEEHIKDVKVIFTRKTDVFVELEDRARIANDNNADLFISIHCNAAGKPVMIKDKKIV